MTHRTYMEGAVLVLNHLYDINLGRGISSPLPSTPILTCGRFRHCRNLPGLNQAQCRVLFRDL